MVHEAWYDQRAPGDEDDGDPVFYEDTTGYDMSHLSAHPSITVSAVAKSRFLVQLSTGAALVVGPDETWKPVFKHGVWILELTDDV